MAEGQEASGESVGMMNRTHGLQEPVNCSMA